MAKRGENAGGRYCCNCSSSVGAEVGRIPVNVVPVDGKGRPEIWCPRCFAQKRMGIEPERFDPAATAAVRCHFCGAESVCFSAVRGRAVVCGACCRPGATMISFSPEDQERIAKGLVEALEEAGASKIVVSRG